MSRKSRSAINGNELLAIKLALENQIDLCEDYLMSQLAIINPKVIILCGATACQTFFYKPFWEKSRISNLRGDFFESQGIQFVPVFHPSYLLRQHSEDEGAPRSLTLQDFINIKEYVKNLNN